MVSPVCREAAGFDGDAGDETMVHWHFSPGEDCVLGYVAEQRAHVCIDNLAEVERVDGKQPKKLRPKVPSMVNLEEEEEVPMNMPPMSHAHLKIATDWRLARPRQSRQPRLRRRRRRRRPQRRRRRRRGCWES